MNEETFKQMLPSLIENYQASDEVKAQVASATLLMTVGPSGVGKTTLMRKLGYPLALSTVTRLPRVNERSGVDYHFTKDYEGLHKQIQDGQFLQFTDGPNGDFYGTKAIEYPANSISTMAVTAQAMPLFETLGFRSIIRVFITPPSYEEWMRRLDNQGFDREKLLKRLSEGIVSFTKALEYPNMYFVLNDDVKTAAKQVENIIVGEVNRTAELEARKTATSILEQLKQQPKKV